MSNIYKEISACRVCGNTSLVDVLDLGEQALTGIFPSNPKSSVPSGPVVLAKCDDASGCGLVQLKQTYEPNMMYGENYGYQSSLNPSMVEHLLNKVTMIKGMGILMPGDVVLDIGCNDGTTLKFFGEDFIRVGIDPTAGKFADKHPPNLKVNTDFFTKSSYDALNVGEKAKVITSFAMFYDLPDPVGFAQDIAKCLKKDGIWIFEQSYLPKLLETNSFDTICQEHLEFYSLKQILYILKQAGLKCVDVQFNNINGGSFSVIAAHINSPIISQDKKIREIIQSETNAGIHTLGIYKNFKKRVERLKNKTFTLLDKLISSGHKVYGIGASTKGNVLLQYYEIGEKLEAIGEVNSDKFGCFCPGTNIPIIEEKKVLLEEDAYLFILPWHFREFFVNSQKFKGKRLIFPLPALEILKL